MFFVALLGSLIYFKQFQVFLRYRYFVIFLDAQKVIGGNIKKACKLNKGLVPRFALRITSYNVCYTKLLRNMINDAGRTDIPVMQGEQSRGDGATDAAFFLAETVAKYPGEVTIIAAGPLGNIDAASRVDGNFYNNVKEIVIIV